MQTFKLDTRFSIAAKINVLTISVILATAVGICVFIIRLEQAAYYDALLNHGKTIAETTAKNCELGIYTENAAALLPVLEALSADAEIAYASVLNRKGLPLATRVFRGSGRLLERPFAADGAAGVIQRELTGIDDGRRYIEILFPVAGAPANDINDVLFRDDRAPRTSVIIGHLRLGLTQEGLRKRMRELILAATAFTSVLVLICSAFTILWSRRITTPLKRLMAATHDVAEGKFDSPVRIGTTDELSDLARSFEHMRDRLRTYRCEVEKRIAAEQQHLREKEQLLMDLHDGIGGITTNICILAEVAQHAKDMDGVKRPLATISRLSREGISEIRSFMQSLDSRELTWQSLVAQLRIQGTTMVEPHRIRFAAETAIDEALDQPGSLLWVNIFRIYKEALTNVIKHANARSVAVMLSVTGKNIFLSIRDDGSGWSDGGQPGRGIPNMKKRAQEVGGTVTVEASGTGTLISLAIPLPVAYASREGEC